MLFVFDVLYCIRHTEYICLIRACHTDIITRKRNVE